MKKILQLFLLCSLLIGAPHAATAKDTSSYPDKPIKFIVPYTPGGLGDTFSRALARGLNEKLGQPVIVENKPGASQIIGAEQVLRSPADGYTIFLGSMTSLATNLGSYKKLRYDPIKDFSAVSKLFSTKLYLTVNTDVPAQSVEELVALAKSKPGELSYASFGSGGSVHLAAELFSREAGLDLINVPYKGSVPALTDVMSGVVTMMFDGGSTVAPQVKSGKLRALAVTGDARSPILPDVPSMSELGYPSVDVGVWWGLMVREGTPQPIIDMLSETIREIVAEPEFIKLFDTAGIDIESSTPEEFQTFIELEAARWPEFMKQIGVVPQ